MHIPLGRDLDTAETRLYGAIVELTTRLLNCSDLGQRQTLREHIAVLRAQLVKLIEQLPIYSDLEIEAMERQRMGEFGLAVAPPMRPVS